MIVKVLRHKTALVIQTVAILFIVCSSSSVLAMKENRPFYSRAELAAIFRHSPLGPIPPDPTNKVANDPRAAKLGQFLFFDRRLSADGNVSCATCHQPTKAFTDGRRLAKGLAIGTRNTPTVLNTAYQKWYFWDGRSDSQWSQALQPLENPREAGSDRLHIAHLVASDPPLRKAYQQIFGPLPSLGDFKRFPAHARPDADQKLPVARAWGRMTPADRIAVNRIFSNLGKAIAAYERKLVDRDSPFDRYVADLRSGNPAAKHDISSAAKRGLRIFAGRGNCELCHSGPTFSDNQFHNLGLPLPPGARADTGRAGGIRALKADPFNAAGRYSDQRTGASEDHIAYLPAPQSQLGAFKTPSLRNVALSAPYMHDGRFASLDQVLEFYSKGKAASRGRLVGIREATANLVPHLSKRDKADLIAFLKTLTSPGLPTTLTEPPAAP